jgi:nucleoside-diphosphate-sugar epimerase
MPGHALCIGGTRFIGRRAVDRFRDAGYDVTVFHRGEHESPFDEDIDHFRGDRTDEDDLAAAAELDPDVVVDLVAYQPHDVRAATGVFDDVDAYVYVSSGAAYGAEAVPKREDETALAPCTDEQATDDSPETYGARKAEGDREVFAAAAEGVDAVSVRPCVVYGPHDYTRRFDYWVQRVAANDRVLVPGDGTNLWHRVSVENVARALQVAAEEGVPGEAYNVGDWRLQTLRETVETVADALETDVDIVSASERELAAGGLEPADFPLYRDPPHVLDTHKLRSLGWEPVGPETAIAETVAASPATDAETAERGPDRAAERRVLDALEG